MVRTRGQGAPPEGFSEYEAPKRTRKTRSKPIENPIVSLAQSLRLSRRRQSLLLSSYPKPPLSPNSPEFPAQYLRIKEKKPQRIEYKDAETQTDPVLTGLPVPINGKRRRDSEEPESTSKRPRNAITPQPERRRPTPFFSTQRKKSYILQAPPLRESPLYAKALQPRLNDSHTARREAKATSPVQSSSSPPSQGLEQNNPSPKTPERSQEQGLFGSVKRFFGGFLGGSPTKSVVVAESNSTHSTPSSHERPRPLPSPTSESPEASSPSHDPHPQHSPPRETAVDLTPPPAWEQSFKRRRYANSLPSATVIDSRMPSEQVGADAEFVRKEAGSNKRVLSSTEGKIPGPRSGGFGIDDNYLDVDAEVDGIDSVALPSTPTKSNIVASTPLRSALRQTGTIGRSGKSVRINPNTAIKHVYGQYGPAGQYHGSTFSDATPLSTTDSSLSSIPRHNVHSILSPTTIENTQHNITPKFRLDSNVFDPNDSSWRPSLANPSPGTFRVPDADEFDDFEEDEFSEVEKATPLAQDQERLPSQPPSTPRMSHAELPQQQPASGNNASFTSNEDSGIFNDSQETRLNKARLDAQKYKPVRSSRLSHGEPARSRSSSPPLTDSDFTESNLEIGTPGDFRPVPRDWSESEINDTPTKQPSRDQLDNTVTGEDGMTEYEREHEHDSWAINLFDQVTPQTYEEAGTADSYITELVRKNWTQRDTEDAIAFWTREFDEGLKAANEAKIQGKQLRWITDPSEIAEHLAAH